MTPSLRAELIKLRRLWLPAIAAGSGLVFAGLVFLTLSGAAQRIAQEERIEAPWQNSAVGDATVTSVLVLPTLVILITGLAFFVEHRGDMWKQLRVSPRPVWEIYAAKFLVIQMLVAIAILAAFAACALGWQLLPEGFRAELAPEGGVHAVLAGLALRLFLALLPVGIIQFALSARFPNILHPVGIGLVLTFACLMLMGPTNQRWLPYAYPGAVIMGSFAAVPGPSLQQVADIDYRPPAGALAGAGGGGAILIDQAHDNRHGIGSPEAPAALGWLAFAAHQAGVAVGEGRGSISEEGLSQARLLVLAGASKPLSAEEVEAIAAWVRSGGALLLLADHEPFAASVEPLARRLGAGISSEMVAGSGEAPPGTRRIRFTAERGGIRPHPITSGVKQVWTYGGQAVWAEAPAAEPLLLLSKPVRTPDGGTIEAPAPPAQLVAFPFGKGRVVLSGETALFTAQRQGDATIGLGARDTDNERLVVNSLRWLMRLPPLRTP